MSKKQNFSKGPQSNKKLQEIKTYKNELFNKTKRKLSFVYWMILIVTVGMLIIGGIYLFSSFPESNYFSLLPIKIRSIALKKIERKAILSLFPQNGEYKLDEIFPVEILLDTKDFEIDGLDVVIKYDPEMLLVAGKAGSRIRIGNVFDNFMGSEINKEEGLIKFSALSKPTEKFQGQGKVATINFQALKKDEAKISFVFKQGSTTDCNASRKGQDVLKEVMDGEYIIE